MRSLTPVNNNTPPGSDNLAATVTTTTTKKPPTDSSRLSRNIRPSSLSPAACRDPATTSSYSSSTSSKQPSLRETTSKKPSVAQIRARRTTNNNLNLNLNPSNTSNTTTSRRPSPTPRSPTTPKPTNTTNTTSSKATTTTTGPPTTTTGPRRITATTTTSTIGRTTKTSSTNSSTTTTNRNPNTTTTSSSPLPSPTIATTPSYPSTISSRRQQPALSSSLRNPLRTRDQNVLNPSRPATAARAKPSPTPSPTSSPAPASAPASALSSPTMPPYDKGGSTTARQPGMPSLAAKGVNTRAPLTPKVAPKVAAKLPPVVTPLGRRPNSNNNNNNNNSQHSTGGGARDDLTSPAPFLAANITPRSGTRQTRVDSNNSTPNGTPNPDRNNDLDRQHSTFQNEPVRRQVVTFSPPSAVGSSRHDATESKFFYASEAKSAQPAPAPKPPVVVAAAPQQRNSTFMYANGSAVEKNRSSQSTVGFTPMLAPSLAPSLSPSLAPTPDPPQSKFFYANGAPNLQPGFRPSSAASGTGSISSESRKLHRTSAGSAGGFSLAQRPMSPNKPMQPPTSMPLVKSNSMPHAPRAQMASPPPLAAPPHKRKISMDAVSQVASHVGSEAPATDAMIMSRFMASQSPTPSELPSPTMSSFFPNQPITIASILQAADDLEDESESEEEEEEDRDLEELHSPTKSTHGDPLNDMVVNARRERKVQDLEITTASLEAINRSLERQLRKQTAELRRYKRLSRSGRLSVPAEPPSEVPAEPTISGLGIEGMDLSDLSEEEEEAEPAEDLEDSMFESSELSETDSGSRASPEPDADRDNRRRQRDEKRLQLDLTKHRELLVDSQKINQSIKRCLNWTEELIKEGKKALEYSVRPSDVALPPRVLQPQYLLDDNEEEQRKDDASTPSSPVESPKSLTAQWSKEPQDRDSGIELQTDGG